jgi:hypothetical protein
VECIDSIAKKVVLVVTLAVLTCPHPIIAGSDQFSLCIDEDIKASDPSFSGPPPNTNLRLTF